MNRHPRRRKPPPQGKSPAQDRAPSQSKAPGQTVEEESGWVFGIHAVRILLAREPGRIRRLAASANRQDGRLARLVEQAQAAGIEIEFLPPEELDARLPGAVHQGVVALTDPLPLLDEAQLRHKIEALPHPPLLLMLDGVQDPRNLGACLRSADACGVDAVIIPERRAAGLTPAAVKIACGAAATVPVARVTNLARVIRWAQSRSIWVVGTGGGADLPLYRAQLTGALMLVLGGEEGGMRRLTGELCDQIVSLPMNGVVESLNVSVAAGVCLYEALRQRELAAAEVSRGG